MSVRAYDLPKGVTASDIAHLYSRVSSGTQLDGHGLRRQESGTDQWVVEHGLTILTSYQDRGVSAYRGKNRKAGELAVILRHIETGIIKPGEHLIIESVDRLSRMPPMAAIGLLHEILSRGIIVHSIFDRRHFTERSVNEDTGQLMGLMISMARANEESRLKGKRVASAWANKRESDDILTAMAPRWLEVENVPGPEGKPIEKFRVIPLRAGKVNWMFEQAAAGISAHGIASMLNKEGYATWGSVRKVPAGGRFWDVKAIKRILTQKAVLGHFTSHRFEFDAEGTSTRVPVRTREDYFPAIVSIDLWQRANDVQARRRAAGFGGSTGKDFANLFAKMMRCECCGSTVIRTGSKRYATLICSSRRVHKCESEGSMPYETFEAEVLEFISEVDLVDNRAYERDAIEKRIATLVFEITNLNAETDNLLAHVADSQRAKLRIGQNEARVQLLEAEKATEQKRFDGIRANESPEDRKASLALLASKMGATDATERFKVRTALNSKMQEVIERIELSTNDHAYVYLYNLPGTRYAFFRGKFVGIRRHQDLTIDGISIRRFEAEQVIVPPKVRGPRGGWTHDEDAKARMASSQRDRLAKGNPLLGRKLPQEVIDKMSATRKANNAERRAMGLPTGSSGWKHTEESKRKMSEAKRAQIAAQGHPSTGRKWSEEAKAKLSTIHKARFAKLKADRDSQEP